MTHACSSRGWPRGAMPAVYYTNHDCEPMGAVDDVVISLGSGPCQAARRTHDPIRPYPRRESIRERTAHNDALSAAVAVRDPLVRGAPRGPAGFDQRANVARSIRSR
jgi:hypothetical protein